MLTNTSGTKILTGYQAQLTSPKISNSNVQTKPGKPDSPKQETDDKVQISKKVRELDQVYQEKENSIEQNYDTNRQKLEREYVQQKNELEREFAQKKQALSINLYA